MAKILVVDDAEMNRELLKEIFEEQWEVLEAEDGQEAVDILDKQSDDISIMFLDLMMPKLNGLDVLQFMKKAKIIDKIPVVMITGESSIESDVKAYEYGAADIIYKPFAPEVVIRRSLNLIELYEHRESIETKLEQRTRELRETQKIIAKNNEFLINALGSVVEFKSMESGEHIQRVKKFTKIILKHIQVLYPEYNLTDNQIDMISQAAALHDVGKIAIPDSILDKPGKLTKDEFEEMKKHSIYGCEILERFKQEDSEFYKYCYEICRWHHEKYDGKGYPDKLVGEEIPIWAQAVAAADCFDALVSKRVYKAAYEENTAFNMICNGECGEFSEKIIACLHAAKLEMFAAIEQ